MQLSTVLPTVLAIFSAGSVVAWYFLQRHIERKPQIETLDITKRVLDIRKELAAQSLTHEELQRYTDELLGVTAQLEPRDSSVFTAASVGPWFLISVLFTFLYGLLLAANLIRNPLPVLSIQTALIAFEVCFLFFLVLVNMVLGVLFLTARVKGPFRIVA
jgi:hypothetical protein